MHLALPVLPISDLRHRAKEVLQQVKKRPIIITQRGRAQAVLVDFDTYNRLVERQAVLEGALDALLLQRARETAQEYLPLDALLRQHEELFGEKMELPTAE